MYVYYNTLESGKSKVENHRKKRPVRVHGSEFAFLGILPGQANTIAVKYPVLKEMKK